MSSFAELAALPGVGVGYALEVSNAAGVVQFRWATADGYYDDTGIAYEARIVSVGNLSRALGKGRTLTVSTIDIVLDNVDAGADVLMDRASFEDVLGWTFRLSIFAYDPANPSDGEGKQLGVFSLFDAPSRTDSEIRLSLADSVLHKIETVVRPPTLREWLAAADADRPFTSTSTFHFDLDTPLPIRFGRERHAMLHVATSPTTGDAVYVLAARRADSAPAVQGIFLGNGSDVTRASLNYNVTNGTFTDHEGQIHEWTHYGQETPGEKTSAVIVVDGVNWYVSWLAVNPFAVGSLLYNNRASAQGLPEQAIATLRSLERRAEWGDALETLGLQFSAVALSEFHNLSWGTRPGFWSPAGLAYGILSQFTSLGSGGVDLASFLRCAAGRPTLCNGSISYSEAQTTRDSDLVESTGSSVLPALEALGLLGGFELVIESDGKVYCKKLDEDFRALAGSAYEFDETQISGVSDRLPSKGERWEPFSRVFVRRYGRTYGPFYNSEFSPSSAITRTVELTWWGDEVQPDFGLQWYENINRRQSKELAELIFTGPDVRPIISFTTTLEALDLELGDFFVLSWTRGGRGTPYSEVLWRVESTTLIAESALVRIEAVWCDDLPDRTRRPYLLDDENNLVRRSNATAGEKFTATTGSTTLACDASTLVASGVAAGDIFEMTDSSEARGSFQRNRCFLIESVTANSVTFFLGFANSVAPNGDGDDFGSAGPYTITTWRILRGHVTYPTSGDDPVLYPSGGLPYGKMCRQEGVYADVAGGFGDAAHYMVG
jgi:hypothetical protein